MSQSANKLLAALPRRDYQRLRPMLRTAHLTAETPLPHCGQTRVYFPGTGLCSIINKMADGTASRSPASATKASWGLTR